MVPWWLPVDLPNISAVTDRLETWLVPIERSFQGLSVAIKTVRIDGELMEIWLNEVCDTYSGCSSLNNGWLSSLLTDYRQRRRSWAISFSRTFSSSNLLTTPLLSFPVLLPTSVMHFSLFYLPVFSYRHYEATLQWYNSLDLIIISHQWWWPASDHNCSLNRTSGSYGMTSFRSHSPS